MRNAVHRSDVSAGGLDPGAIGQSLCFQGPAPGTGPTDSYEVWITDPSGIVVPSKTGDAIVPCDERGIGESPEE